MTDHKPISNDEAKEIAREIASDGPVALPKFTTARFLHDRDVAMEIIQHLSDVLDENKIEACPMCLEARALLAAVKGEE